MTEVIPPIGGEISLLEQVAQGWNGGVMVEEPYIIFSRGLEALSWVNWMNLIAGPLIQKLAGKEVLIWVAYNHDGMKFHRWGVSTALQARIRVR
jgi:hypothetical protein